MIGGFVVWVCCVVLLVGFGFVCFVVFCFVRVLVVIVLFVWGGVWLLSCLVVVFVIGFITWCWCFECFGGW